VPIRTEQHQRLPQDAWDAGVAHVDACTNPIERSSRLAFTKAEPAKRAERLFVDPGLARAKALAVHGAVGMPKDQPSRNPTLDEELPTVQCAVMGAT
jgi:hypothetical protein